MISNGSLITEKVARGMIEAGLDAINISVDAGGQGGLRADAHRAQLRQGDRQHRAPRPDPRPSSAGAGPKLILSFVRQNNSADEQAFIEHWRNVADKIHITELHNWAGTLNHESDVNYPCYRPWLTFTVLWDGRVSLCCADFDGKTILGDLNTQTIARHLECRALPGACAASTSRAAGPTSAAPAICRGKTPRSGSPSWPEPKAGLLGPGRPNRRILWR